MSSEVIQFYANAQPIPLPITIPGKEQFVLQKLNTVCFKCEKPTENIRGTCTEHANCIDFLIAGRCDPCKAITQSRFRVYSDGRILLQKDNTWKEYAFKPVFSVKHLLRKLGLIS